MSDTHINAFFADVDAKLQDVLSAQAEYEAAKDRLEAKKLETGWEDPEEVVQKAAKPEEPSENEEKEPKKSHNFRRNR